MGISEEIKLSYQKGSYYTKLIYLNIGTFLLIWIISLFYKDIQQWVAIPGTFKELIYKPWTLISYMFVHAGFMHLFSNMLMLFWFGRLFMQFLHNKQLLAVYLLGGFVGAFIHLGSNYLIPENQRIGIIGASGAVMAIVFAVSSFKPNYIINLIFIGPVKLKYIALVAFIIDLMGLASDLKAVGLGSGVAHFAHIGGALYGLWFGVEMRRGKDISKWFGVVLNETFSFFQSSGNKTKMKIEKGNNSYVHRPKTDAEYRQTKAASNEELDKILDKISKTGYESLTNEEKKFLFNQKK